jgi:hypothetical protein
MMCCTVWWPFFAGACRVLYYFVFVVYSMRMFMSSCTTDGVSRSKLLNVVVYYYYCYNHPFMHIIYKLLILNVCNKLEFQ